MSKHLETYNFLENISISANQVKAYIDDLLEENSKLIEKIKALEYDKKCLVEENCQYQNKCTELTEQIKLLHLENEQLKLDTLSKESEQNPYTRCNNYMDLMVFYFASDRSSEFVELFQRFIDECANALGYELLLKDTMNLLYMSIVYNRDSEVIDMLYSVNQMNFHNVTEFSIYLTYCDVLNGEISVKDGLDSINSRIRDIIYLSDEVRETSLDYILNTILANRLHEISIVENLTKNVAEIAVQIEETGNIDNNTIEAMENKTEDIVQSPYLLAEKSTVCSVDNTMLKLRKCKLEGHILKNKNTLKKFINLKLPFCCTCGKYHINNEILMSLSSKLPGLVIEYIFKNNKGEFIKESYDNSLIHIKDIEVNELNEVPLVKELIITKGNNNICTTHWKAVIKRDCRLSRGKKSNIQMAVATLLYCRECNRFFITSEQYYFLTSYFQNLNFTVISQKRFKREIANKIPPRDQRSIIIYFNKEESNNKQSNNIALVNHAENPNNMNNNNINNTDLNPSSRLNRLGYNTKIGRELRWKILKEKAIPELGYNRVESHIKWLINFNGSRKGMENAVFEWKFDLEKLRKNH